MTLADFRPCAPIPAMVIFLGDNGGNIAGIPQSRALGTTLHLNDFLAQHYTLHKHLGHNKTHTSLG